jgi:hypothetical protein
MSPSSFVLLLTSSAPDTFYVHFDYSLSAILRILSDYNLPGHPGRAFFCFGVGSGLLEYSVMEFVDGRRA